MSTLPQAQDLSGARTASLRLYLHSSQYTGGVFWRINGFRAKLLVWTPEEWANLIARPADAQLHPSGVWCALRLD
jgi:hypothetical protein